MEYLKIAVVSADPDYNRVFSASLLSVCRQIEVRSYLTEQFVLQWAEYHGRGAFYDRFDIILWAGDEIRDTYGDNIVYLTDRATAVGKDYAGNRFAIYKYSTAGSVAADLFDIYAHLSGREFPLMKRDDVGLYVFASYCGGSGCSTLAKAVCQEMIRFHGKRVLYISLEEVDSSAGHVSVPDGIKTQGEFLYRLLGKNSMPFLEPYLVRDCFGVCFFAPACGRNPLLELSKEDMQKMIAALMGSGMFDVIVIDLSTCLGDAALALMEPSERICLVSRSAVPEAR